MALKDIAKSEPVLHLKTVIKIAVLILVSSTLMLTLTVGFVDIGEVLDDSAPGLTLAISVIVFGLTLSLVSFTCSRNCKDEDEKKLYLDTGKVLASCAILLFFSYMSVIAFGGTLQELQGDFLKGIVALIILGALIYSYVGFVMGAAKLFTLLTNILIPILNASDDLKKWYNSNHRYQKIFALIFLIAYFIFVLIWLL